MKKMSVLTLVAVFLCMSSLAFAEVKEYGPDFMRFTIDVPDGWKATATDTGTKITTPDEKSAIQVQITKHNGSTAEQIAKGMAEQLGLKKVEKVQDSAYNISGEVDNTPTVCTIVVENDNFLLIVMAGELEKLGPVVKTIKAKN